MQTCIYIYCEEHFSGDPLEEGGEAFSEAKALLSSGTTNSTQNTTQWKQHLQAEAEQREPKAVQEKEQANGNQN